MMNKSIRTIPADTNLCDAAKAMNLFKVGALIVEEGETMIGILSESDLVRRGMAKELDLRKETVRNVMSSPIISIDIGRATNEANDLMGEKGIRHLAITDSGKIVGIISVRDLLRYYKNWGA